VIRKTAVCIFATMLAAAVAFAADVASTPLPSSEVPGSSPAGRMPDGTGRHMDKPTPSAPTPLIRGQNFPSPEPVAPKAGPKSPESLPGSGRRDVVPQ
jgi:hypothetical protein